MTSANTLFNEYAGAPNASLNTLVYSTSFSRGTTEQQLSARSDLRMTLVAYLHLALQLYDAARYLAGTLPIRTTSKLWTVGTYQHHFYISFVL